MSDSNKKMIAIIVVVLAVVIAIFSITRTVQSTQPKDAGPLGGSSGAPSDLPGGKSKSGGE
jgi:hypothetical protein